MSEVDASVSATRKFFGKFLEEENLTYNYFLLELRQDDVRSFLEKGATMNQHQLVNNLWLLIKCTAKAFMRYSLIRYRDIAPYNFKHLDFTKPLLEMNQTKRVKCFTPAVAHDIVVERINRLATILSHDRIAEIQRELKDVVVQLLTGEPQTFKSSMKGMQLNGLGSRLRQCLTLLTEHMVRLHNGDEPSKVFGGIQNSVLNSPLHVEKGKQQFPDIAEDAMRTFFSTLGEGALELKSRAQADSCGITPFLNVLSERLSDETTRMVVSNIVDFAMRALQAKHINDYLDMLESNVLSSPLPPLPVLSKKDQERIARSVVEDPEGNPDFGDNVYLKSLREWLVGEFNNALNNQTFNEAKSNGSVMPLLKLFVALHRYDEECTNRVDRKRQIKEYEKILPKRKRHLLLPLGDLSKPPAAFAKALVLARGAKVAAAQLKSGEGEYVSLFPIPDETTRAKCITLLEQLARKLKDEKENLNEFYRLFAPEQYANPKTSFSSLNF